MDASKQVLRLRRAALVLSVSLSSMLLASAVSHQLIYERIVVPNLSTVLAIPFHWYLGLGAPVLVTLLGLGLWVRNPLELIFSALGTGLAVLLFAAWAAHNHEPGFIKVDENTSYRIELAWWALGPFVTVSLLLQGCSGLLGKPRPRASARSQA